MWNMFCPLPQESLISLVLFPVIDDSAPNLLCLLLLAELIVHSTSRPANSPALCRTLKSMLHQVDLLMRLSRKLHGLVRQKPVMWLFLYPNVKSGACLHLLEAWRITPFKNQAFQSFLSWFDSFDLCFLSLSEWWRRLGICQHGKQTGQPPSFTGQCWILQIITGMLYLPLKL